MLHSAATQHSTELAGPSHIVTCQPEQQFFVYAPRLPPACSFPCFRSGVGPARHRSSARHCCTSASPHLPLRNAPALLRASPLKPFRRSSCRSFRSPAAQQRATPSRPAQGRPAEPRRGRARPRAAPARSIRRRIRVPRARRCSGAASGALRGTRSTTVRD